MRELRRPIVLTGVSLTCLAIHHILLRAMAHGHVAHVLLGMGNTVPKADVMLLAISLVIVRFIAYILVPGLMLAAGAEIVAYVLVGPKRTDDENEHHGLVG